MIEKLERYIREEDGIKISCPPDNVHIISKINELCDAVNGILDYAPLEMAMKAERSENVQPDAKIRSENVQPDYMTTIYVTDGHTKEYYGQNGASIVIDYPLPAGYVITIRESKTKGGDNE